MTVVKGYFSILRQTLALTIEEEGREMFVNGDITREDDFLIESSRTIIFFNAMRMKNKSVRRSFDGSSNNYRGWRDNSECSLFSKI